MVHSSAGEQHDQAGVEIVELSEEEEREEQAVQVHSSPVRISTEEVTATAFAEPEITPEDQDVFAPEARLPVHIIPEGRVVYIPNSVFILCFLGCCFFFFVLYYNIVPLMPPCIL